MDTQIEFLKRIRRNILRNNELIEMNLKADYFIVKEAKEATKNALEMNNSLIKVITQHIEAERLGITLTS